MRWWAFAACVCLAVGGAHAATVEGVITRAGRPAQQRFARVDNAAALVSVEADGHYLIREVPQGATVLRITARSSFRRYVPIEVEEPRTVVSLDLVPHCATDQMPWQHDWRLHRSWGNALDDPWDLDAVNSLCEPISSASDLVLMPVQAAAVLLEVVWTPVGFGAGYVIRAMPGEQDPMFSISRPLLAGYLPVEAVTKGLSVAVRTVLWPLDRLVSIRSRRALHEYREQVLANHASRESSPEGATP